MTYADYCLQFRQIDYYSTEETSGFERHHLTPRAVQIEKYGRVIDNTCILVTREQHTEAHRIFNLEFPLCKSQEIAYRLMTTCKGMLGEHHSEEARRKISEAHKGENNPFYGRTHSEETKMKMSEAQKGEKNHNYGKPLTEEHRRKISDNHADISGEKHPMYGKHHSEESKAKMSEAKKGKHPSEETKQKVEATYQLKAQEYHKYKSQGGALKWNEWCKANKER